MNVTGEIRSTNSTIQRLIQQRDFMAQNKQILEDCPFHIVLTGSPRVIIKDIKDLNQARRFMGKLFGDWHDKINNIFYSCGTAIATWQDKNHEWQLWLECPIEEFPKSLLPSDKCH